MEQNEQKLIERASGGDPSAFNQLMAMHEKRMYAVALRMFANREDAQDCLQEAMLRIYRAIGGFKETPLQMAELMCCFYTGIPRKEK